MNKLGALLVIGTSVVSPCLPLDAVVAATLQSRTEAASAADRYIVQFDDGMDPELEASVLRGLGVEVLDVFGNVFPGAAVRASASLIEQVRGVSGMARVEADHVINVDSVPETVVQPGPSWGLDRIDQRSLPLSGSYSYNGAGAGVTAYIIDSGINAAHVDFGGRVRSGVSTVGDTPSTDDCFGHGTHVAGTVGGQTWGVAKSVSLVAVRVLDCIGSTDAGRLIAGLDWVIADHQAGSPAVANLSLGGVHDDMVDLSVQRVINDGVTVVVAAGNENQNACNVSPADTPNAITVAASTQADARASFSNFGPCVDVFAPGTNIVSDYIGSITATGTGSGTSMAAPHVAGAAAVLLSERPTWTPTQVARDLLALATPNVISDVAGSPNKLLFSAPITPPANDDFVAAAPIDLEGPTDLAGSNVDATMESGEPAHGPTSGGTSVWWTFAPSDFGTVTLSTEGSSFDTMLAVYSGTAVISLVALTSNDGPGNGSTVTLGVEPGRTYYVAVDGGAGTSGSIALGFKWRLPSLVPLVPARLLESRSGVGVGSVDGLFAGLGVRAAGSVTELVVAGRGGVAVDASAVVLTVTVTEPGAAGFVSVFPCGVSQPLASSLNFVAGATVANAVVSGVGVGGRVCVFTSSATQLVVDVNGFFGAVSSLVPLVPARLLESRSGVGVGSVDGLFAGLGVRAAGSVTELVVAGRGGVAVDASAVVLTVTVTEPGAAGFVSVFPCGVSQPLASSLNFVAGATVANAVVSGVGVGGRVCVFTSSATQLVVDVNGFFGAVSSLVPLVPARLLESRSGVGVGSVDGLFAGLGVRAAGSVTELVVAGRGGVAVDASAVVLTVTVTEPGAAGFVSVFPCGVSQPLASSLNFVAGATVANAVVSGVGVGGRVCVFTSSATQLVVDVNGFFQ